ncbi:MAG: aldehyde dehydrogenase family protein, partial [Planctomycetes bacterium]|nr:aldehyde dehydrogenase family protein [Planctomycetota bacterium]
MKYPTARNFIGGEFVDHSGDNLDVVSPLDGSKISEVPCSTAREVDSAVSSAIQAFPEWSAQTVKKRAQVAFRYR